MVGFKIYQLQTLLGPGCVCHFTYLDKICSKSVLFPLVITPPDLMVETWQVKGGQNVRSICEWWL